MSQQHWGSFMADLGSNGRMRIPVSVMLPTNLFVGILCAVASWGATYALLGKQVSDSAAAIANMQGRLAVVESDNRDQKNAIDQLQKLEGETAGKLEQSSTATTAQLTQIQIAIARLQVTVDNQQGRKRSDNEFPSTQN